VTERLNGPFAHAPLRELEAASLSTKERPLQLCALHRRELPVFEERDDFFSEFVLRRRKLCESSPPAQTALDVLIDARAGDAPKLRDPATKRTCAGEHRLELVIGKSHGGRLPLQTRCHAEEGTLEIEFLPRRQTRVRQQFEDLRYERAVPRWGFWRMGCRTDLGTNRPVDLHVVRQSFRLRSESLHPFKHHREVRSRYHVYDPAPSTRVSIR
jgi:hypothetical protein